MAGSSEEVHKVFKNDPVKFKSLVNKFVEVESVKGKKSSGIVYTIDPVSECIVLMNKVNGKWCADIVMGFYEWKIVKIVEDAEVEPIPENMLMNFQELPSKEDLGTKKERLKEWLLKNHLPFEDDGVNLKMGNDVVIIPPYGIEQCLCTNEIILDRVQKFITALK